jgi:anti-sigma B factor antagonist
MHFKTASERLDGAHVVSVSGEIDLATGPELERALRDLPDDGTRSVIVDLSDCGFMDSTGMHILARTHARLGRSGGRLAVVTNHHGILKVLELTGLDKLFPIYPSRAKALGDTNHH